MKYLTFALSLFIASQSSTIAQQFSVIYKSSAFQGPFTGNVILYLSQKNETPKDHNRWPCYSVYVRNVMPDQPVVFTDAALSYPNLLSRIPRGDYFVQAVWDRDLGGRVIGQSAGNMYNPSQKITMGDTTERFLLVCDSKVPTPVFADSKFVKEIKVRSKLLSRFHHRPEYLAGAVILPVQYYTEPQRRFPVYFMVGGFGGAYYHYSKTESTDTAASIPLDTIACIKVYLDGDCRLGHSTYANSDNNGPVGDAFAKEFIPELDRRFRTNGGRVIRGHSSGGWTVAYLMTHYPSLFAGGNASAPDPVDFRRFNETNLYTDHKRVEFVDWAKFDKRKDLPSVYDRPNIAHSIEQVIYRGEQNVSFDAVFGPKGKDGLPIPLYDPQTGKIDRQVLAHWKQYDLTQYIIKHWGNLKTDLNGKLRISVGTEDNAQCPAIRIMETEMKKLGANIEFAYYPGTHFTVATPAYGKAQNDFLLKKYQEWLVRIKR